MAKMFRANFVPAFKEPYFVENALEYMPDGGWWKSFFSLPTITFECHPVILLTVVNIQLHQSFY